MSENRSHSPIDGWNRQLAAAADAEARLAAIDEQSEARGGYSRQSLREAMNNRATRNESDHVLKIARTDDEVLRQVWGRNTI